VDASLGNASTTPRMRPSRQWHTSADQAKKHPWSAPQPVLTSPMAGQMGRRQTRLAGPHMVHHPGGHPLLRSASRDSSSHGSKFRHFALVRYSADAAGRRWSHGLRTNAGMLKTSTASRMSRSSLSWGQKAEYTVLGRIAVVATIAMLKDWGWKAGYSLWNLRVAADGLVSSMQYTHPPPIKQLDLDAFA
jgi:hypothetical protein